LAVISLIFIVLIALISFPLASIVAPIPPNKIELRETGDPPGNGHFLGTDLTGRDVWSRVVYGGRVSLSVGLVAVSILLTIGTLLGSDAG
jgi:peptide/nickel transport system permease protein